MYHLSLLSGRRPWGEEMSPEVGSPHLCIKGKTIPVKADFPNCFRGFSSTC